jgi:serine/threonine protein kinase
MTRLCLSAISSQQGGEDTAGYRNVRGRAVIGAWNWLPEWNMGVGVEMERAEALQTVGRIRRLFDVLFAVVGLSTLAAVGLSRRFGLYRRASEKGIAGTYVLDRRIGAGGTSEVYLAHHAHLKRPTAVKILNLGGADAQAGARFEREAKLVSRLSHPNTVQIYDYGRTRDGRFYLATEYLEGLNLAQLVALGGPLEPARAVHLLDQICGSLEEAHAAGLVHRDIKPANIMVCRRGGLYDVVKVLDFGIARSTADGTADLTQANQLAGTPLYIAPERIRAPQSTDPRSDLYSLGAVAFHLLAGRDVFEGPGAPELLYQVLSVEPPAPSRFRGAPLPPDLERLVLDLLAKDPERRPASASAVRERLSALETPERWDQRDARAWWVDHESRIARALTPPPT